jgi:hypothetical protein
MMDLVMAAAFAVVPEPKLTPHIIRVPKQASQQNDSYTAVPRKINQVDNNHTLRHILNEGVVCITHAKGLGFWVRHDSRPVWEDRILQLHGWRASTYQHPTSLEIF